MTTGVRTKNGKTYARCRCGLIFIGKLPMQRWSAHTWDCYQYEEDRKKLNE